eukprot:scaffold113400_cov22-Tisochrysis_lutea.AAC.4
MMHRHVWGCLDCLARGHQQHSAHAGSHQRHRAVSLQVCCVVHDLVPLAGRDEALCVGPPQDRQP